jgi:hypothetical protein
MRRMLLFFSAAFATAAIAVPAAMPGNPHPIGSCTVTQSGNTLSVVCKEAGLGGEAQVEVVGSGTAECINPGSHHPKAANKTSVSGGGQFPVQNGKADISFTMTATFSPDCTPPMTVVFSNITVTDVTNNIQLFP